MSRTRILLSLGALLALTAARDARAQTFTYHPPGDLIEGSGQGRVDDKIYAPGMRFPMEMAPAFANSQVYNPGGYLGPAGSQCDAFNFSYPWRDNYCEIRSWDMPLCPAGTGHQGQDIRAASCEKNVHWVVAATDGTITNVGSYSVYLTDASGNRFDYLHMGSVQVAVGNEVTRGQRIGKVSNEFGGTPTSVHLHFNLRQYVDGVGTVYVPPYLSLITSYQDLVGGPAKGALEGVGCDVIRGWAVQVQDPQTPITVELGFGQNGVVTHTAERLADAYRDDLCENVGYCNHGLRVPSPLSLFDGTSWDVSAASLDEDAGSTLAGSPLTLQCDPPELSGAKRALADLDGWTLDAFWDAPPTDAGAVEALPAGKPMATSPTVWRDASGDLWIYDEPFDLVRRLSDDAALAWRIAPALIEDEADLSAYTVGDDWPARPILLSDDAGEYLLDTKNPAVIGDGDVDDPTQPTPEGSGDADSGCGCEAPGRGPISGGPLAAACLLLGLALRRRRR
ncbi:MAG: M23 family metallopeptidase [Myxococcales bacterium]|nr:M23 family metallopeptidase [Myxococcales bacterium]